MNFSSKIKKCSYSPIRKFYSYQVECEKKGTTVLHLNIGQPDIKTPKCFFNAINSYTGEVIDYAPSPGIPALLEAIQKYYSNIGVTLSTSDILVTTGGSEALSLSFQCILDEGDEIMVPDPLYSNYLTFTNMTGASVNPIPTKAQNGYKYADKQLLEKCLTPKTRALLITNPGNPTGVVLTDEEKRVIKDFVIEHDLFLIVDEVYREFIYTDEPESTFASYDDLAENLILIDSISKRFSATGARVGCVVSKNKELIAHMTKLCQARLSVATLDQIGAAALYNEISFDFFDEVRKEYKRRRDTVCEELSKIPGVQFDIPQGAFYLMATLPVDDTEEFQKWLFTDFEEDGYTVMYAPGAGFYQTPNMGKNEIRIAYVTNCDELRHSIQLLGKAIEKYNGLK